MNDEITNVRIKCPECGTIQDAIIEHTLPFSTYVHFCEKCGYVIMESEWEEIKETEDENN